MNTSSATKLAASLITGLFFGIGAFFLLRYFDTGGVLSAVAVGLLFAWLLYGVMHISDALMKKRYAEAEKHIASPVWCKANGNVRTGAGVRNANIYFCEAGIVFISLDGRPFVMEQLPLEEIRGYMFEAPELRIISTDGGIYTITSPDVDKVAAALRGKGWIA